MDKKDLLKQTKDLHAYVLHSDGSADHVWICNQIGMVCILMLAIIDKLPDDAVEVKHEQT